MAKLFIIYSRSDQVQARLLAADLEDLSHSVWLDAELAGGQFWWEQILKEIRGCEIFVVVMSKASVVDSLACKREFQYAADLQKPILPVLVAEDVSVSLLPAELQKVQFVNYQHRDINSIKALARALQALPLGKELPEPLPTAPEPPISYLASLSHLIDLASFLDLDTQSRIVIELKSSLRDPATALDAQLLLKRLRGVSSFLNAGGGRPPRLMHAGPALSRHPWLCRSWPPPNLIHSPSARAAPGHQNLRRSDGLVPRRPPAG
jgi:hypothetical protein